MANPVQMSCPKGEFTKVMSSKTSGRVHLQIEDNDRVSQMPLVYGARKDAGSPPPLSLSEAFLVDDNNLELDHDSSSDLYLYPVSIDIPVLVDA